MKVLIDAGIPGGGVVGGIEQFIMGLIFGLGNLDGSERYLISSPAGSNQELRRLAGSNSKFVEQPLGTASKLAGSLGPGARVALGTLVRRLGVRVSRPPVPGHEIDVVNVLHQTYGDYRAPVVFCPHDLQHHHFPEFLGKREVRNRVAVIDAGCRRASAVVLPSAWGRRDAIEKLGLSRETTFAVPHAPATSLYPDPDDVLVKGVRAELAGEGHLLFYPAKPWPHKNHGRLLEALSILSKRGSRVRLVLTGRIVDGEALMERARSLGIEDRVRMLGFVDPQRLRALYRVADLMVFPSLFEGGGIPLLEAFSEGLPVVCSDAASLPEYAGDAAILFDPMSSGSIATAIESVLREPDLRVELAARGRARAATFDWLRVARTYRAIYRSVVGIATQEDEALLDEARNGS